MIALEWGTDNIRYVFPIVDRSYPLYLESIGYSAWERLFERNEGYPHYHWLHTIDGVGSFTYRGETVELKKGMGALLTPLTPHHYAPASARWQTIYITFGGAAASAIMKSLQMDQSTIYEEEAPIFSKLFNDLFHRVETYHTHTSVEYSTDLYYFLMQLKKYGMFNDQPSLSQHYRQLSPLLQWIEQHLAHNIGLLEMANYAQISIPALQEIFQQAFQLSPYAYLIQLRIREAKRLLLENSQLTLREIALLTGFNDVSHFVATFRKREGLTPGKYRELHL